MFLWACRSVWAQRKTIILVCKFLIQIRILFAPPTLLLVHRGVVFKIFFIQVFLLIKILRCDRCLAVRMTMHACQIGPTDTTPPCPGSPLRACVGTKGGTLWGRQPFCPHSSSATQVCGRCDYTLPLFWDRSGSQA